MSSSDSLVYAAAILAAAYGIGWALAPRLLQLARPVAAAFMVFNLLFALSLTAETWGDLLASDAAHAAAIACALLSLMAVRAGVQVFLRLASAWREGLIVLLLALVADQVLRSNSAARVYQLLPELAAQLWIMGRLCALAYTPLRRDFSHLASAAVLSPFALWGLWQVIRLPMAADTSPSATWWADLGNETHPLAPAWLAFAALLGMNMAALGVVIARMLAHLRELTLRDSLTGIMNRRAIEMSLSSEYEKLRRHGQIFCVASIDLDRFQRVHDEFGRAASDAALFHAVQLIKGQLRNCDAIGRVGDEEFLVIFPMTRLHGGREAAERIRAALSAAPFPWDNRAIGVTASLGVAECFNPEEPVQTLLRRTDHALYGAKNAGRNRVEVAPN